MDNVAVTTVIGPSVIVVVFIPQSRHRIDPLEALQEIDFPAPVAIEPGLTVIELKSPGLNEIVNCKLAGGTANAVPPRLKFNGTAEPASPDPEESCNVRF